MKKTKQNKNDTENKTKNEANSPASNLDEPKSNLSKKYVVLRGGIRVSSEEYDNPEDEQALNERDFWSAISKNWSNNEKVEIVEYNNKLHRVW